MTEEQVRRSLSRLPAARASMPDFERVRALAALDSEFRKRAPRSRALAWIGTAGQAAFALGLLVAVAALSGS